MFYVFGVNPEQERQRARKAVLRQKDESFEAWTARVEAAASMARPKQIAQYGIQKVAEQYLEALREQGFEKLSVRVVKLLRPAKSNANPSRQFVDVSEIPRINMAEQEELRGLLAGGRFA